MLVTCFMLGCHLDNIKKPLEEARSNALSRGFCNGRDSNNAFKQFQKLLTADKNWNCESLVTLVKL